MEAVFLRVAGLRADADVIDAVQLQVVLRTVREVVERGAEQDRDGIAWIAREVDEDVTDTVDAQISHQVGRPVVSAVPARDVIDRWVDDNVGLIRSIATTAHDDVAEVIREGAMAGTTTRDLTRQIAQRFNVAQSRGELIARDQTAKLSSQINQERQREHGVTRYQWSSSGDERVRQRHAELDGQIFDWSAPPIADERAGLRGHPGEIWQCRCDAEPVLEEDDVPGLLRRARTQQERELALLRESPIVTGEIGSIYDWNRKRLRELARGESSAVGL